MSDVSNSTYNDWAKILPICPLCKFRAGYSFFTHPQYGDKHATCRNCGAKWFLDDRNEERMARLEKASEALRRSLPRDLFKEQTFDFWNKMGQKEVEREQQEFEAKKQNLERLEKAGRYEDAALGYESLGMYEKAGQSRRLAKTTYQISTNFQMGKDGAISVSCPHCGGPHTIASKSNEIICQWCGNHYFIPNKILDIL